jgi:glycosyltransferase involved in cell wall biosynthesis
MPDPKFTIVIPTHNGEAYIAQAVESVLNQTYPHFEIIVLEHESSDRTLEIVSSYSDLRVRLCSTNQPQTIETNWGRILDLDLSEYVTILGHDDVFDPEFLQEVATLIAEEPKASLYQVQLEEIDPSGNLIRRTPKIAYRETADQYLSAVMEDREEVFGTGFVTRSEDYRRVGGILPFPGLLYSDFVLWYRLTEIAYKVCSPKVLARYRVHPQSTHVKSNFSRFYQATLLYYDFLLTTGSLKDTPQIAYAEADKRLQNSYRTAVAEAILAPEKGLAELQITKQQIARGGSFTLHDRVARIYEAFITTPSWLRQLALLSLNIRRTLLRFLANR